MRKIIKRFSDGSILEYDKGSFDDWCVYLTRPNVPRIAPKDVDYFTRFQQLSTKYGNRRIYNDFVAIYEKTNSNPDTKVLQFITELSKKYQSDALRMDILFTIVYASMVAEENKERAILKKRIKRLGMHQVLLERLSPSIAASFSRGKKWRELNKECKKRGF